MAAVTAFQQVGQEPVISQAGRYSLLWQFYDGTWRTHPEIKRQRTQDPRLYRHTLLIWNLARAVTRLYAQSVYAGDLSTDGKPLPDGTRGAIPIDGQTGDETQDAAIQVACAELWAMWNWRQFMSLRPKMAAVLGDCLTELVDDVPRGKVLPRTIWPGYVTDLELDLVGNVKRYAIEYQVSVEGGTKFGQTVKAETYTYRKEVDQATFRYYRDGKPYDEFGEGPVVPNLYRFVPAVWDRHEIVWGDRGLGAFEGALQSLMHINSVFSHALDYQRKQFAAPVGVKGANFGRRRGSGPIVMPGGTTSDDEDATSTVETLGLLDLGADGDFATVQFDVGQTVQMVTFLQDALVAEFPESRFGQEILQMTQVTSPGVERALGPIIGLVKQVRSNHDAQTTKIIQMSLAIIGQRLKNNDYPTAIITERPARYKSFEPFDLTSYGRGALDFMIADRSVINPTTEERINELLLLQNLESPVLLRKAGLTEEEIAELIQGREEREVSREAALERRFNSGLSRPDVADDDQAALDR